MNRSTHPARSGFCAGAAAALLLDLLAGGNLAAATHLLLLLAVLAGAVTLATVAGQALVRWLAARRDGRETIARVPVLLSVSPALREELLLAEVREVLAQYDFPPQEVRA